MHTRIIAEAIVEELITKVEQRCELVAREKVAQMMLRLSIATGHGDTIDDLLRELEAYIEAKIAR